MKHYIFIIFSICIASYSFEANSQNTFYYNSHKSYSAELQYLANCGDPKAINNLGSCYDRGDGIQQDHKKAFELFSQAAQKGEILACYNLGIYYDKGIACDSDIDKAITYYSKAAVGDLPPAMYGLGNCYLKKGLTKDGLYWLEQSASKNFVLAMYDLGHYYYKHKSFSDAKNWFHKASDKNFKIANTMLGNIYNEEGKQELAKHYYLRASEEGEVFATYKLGELYYKNKSFSEAKKWLCKASEQNFNHADILLARIYEDEGKDDLVIHHYTKAANNGELWAMDNLASFYLGKHKFTEAVKWMEKAYSKDFLVVCHNLADCYFWGNGVQQSYDKAYEIFQKGTKESSICLYRLAMMTRNGQGCTKNVVKGIEMLKEAADNGVGRARYQIGVDYYTGEDIGRNYANAVKYLQLALTDKYLLEDARGDIYKKLSTCYRFGRGVAIDIPKADEYLSEAAKYGNPDATKIQKWLYKK